MSFWKAIGAAAGTAIGGPWLGAAIGSAIDDHDSRKVRNEVNEGTAEQNRLNRQLAREQMAYQGAMSSTSWQRGVADMQKAGINPMLAVNQGGASTPQGATTRVENEVAGGVASANQAAQTMQALQSMQLNEAQIQQVKALTAKTTSETLTQDVHTARAAAELKLVQNQGSTEAQKGQLINEQVLSQIYENVRLQLMKEGGGFTADVNRRKSEAELAALEIPKSKAEAEFYKDLGQANPYLKQLMMILQGIRR